ncbi:hypothetical protein Alches_12590 [Alicyclobacillus hesperidum subsp. aegles]|uniref:hypothetical protein n=1 Tax=Alicyclobacillus hesperidum TaxID=89784 RepID=UPI00222907C5|nr:hypothetical protein [Alicyclobacillus hesperidum]GLG01220.1 hypothetical protein Alches_12590 [Alicyclobacillus hesperidum subsp. aegles]
MDTAIFVGFQHEGTIKGCTWHTNMEEYTPRKEKVLDMIRSKDIDYAADIFAHIEWTTFEEMIGDGDGIYLINLFKRGVDGYEENIRRVLKFLYQDVRRNNNLINSQVSKLISKRDGQTMALLSDSAAHYHEGKFDIAFIFDLDAGKVEVIQKQPTLVD